MAARFETEEAMRDYGQDPGERLETGLFAEDEEGEEDDGTALPGTPAAAVSPAVSVWSSMTSDASDGAETITQRAGRRAAQRAKSRSSEIRDIARTVREERKAAEELEASKAQNLDKPEWMKPRAPVPVQRTKPHSFVRAKDDDFEDESASSSASSSSSGPNLQRLKPAARAGKRNVPRGPVDMTPEREAKRSRVEDDPVADVSLLEQHRERKADLEGRTRWRRSGERTAPASFIWR